MTFLSSAILFLLTCSASPGLIERPSPTEKCIEVRKYSSDNLTHWANVLSSGSGSTFAIDGDKSTELRDDYHCAQTKITDNLSPLWGVYFGSSEIVDRVFLYTLSVDNPNYIVSLIRPLHQPQTDVVVVENVDETKCRKVRSVNSFTEYDCGGQRGESVIIIGAKNESLILCQVVVETMKFPSENIAKGKPTDQSSLFRNAVSGLAVDGNRVNHGKFYSYSEDNELTAQCSHTKDEGEQYPWWSVDLLSEYLVNKVTLYNRGEGLESRLHDFEIRVGNKNIRELDDGSQRFRKNPICASYINNYVSRGEEFECKTPLVGSYVSIQIVKKCTIPSCHMSAKVKNILTLCEVEINGISLNSFSERNVIRNFKLQDLIETSDTTDEDIRFPWISIYLNNPSVINRANIILKTNIDGTGLVPDFDIRIGNHPITSDYNYERFKRNILCYRMIDGNLESASNLFQCYQPLFGRYMTIQVIEPCDNDQCLSKMHNLFGIKKIEAFGHRGVVPLVTAQANGNQTFQSSTLHNAWSSLAVNGKLPIERFTPNSVAYCAQTNPEKHPWWLLFLTRELMVEEIIVYLPGNKANTHFKDVEIVVTKEYVKGSLRNDYFVSTPDMICATSEDKNYPEGENRFECKKPIQGRSVVVRITNDSDNSILNICEVEVIGCLPGETERKIDLTTNSENYDDYTYFD